MGQSKYEMSRCLKVKTQTAGLFLGNQIGKVCLLFLILDTNSNAAGKNKNIQVTPKSENRKIASPSKETVKTQAKKAAIFADIFATVGYISPALPPGTASSSSSVTSISTPFLMQGEIGVSGSYRLPLGIEEINDFDFYLGLTASYRYIGQYSNYDSTIGNFRGTRVLPIAPTLVVQAFSKWLLKADFQFLGSYTLSNTTAEGQTLFYSSPLGGRVAVLYPIYLKNEYGMLYGGIQTEYLTFKKRTITSVSETQLTEPLVFWQGGIILDWVF